MQTLINWRFFSQPLFFFSASFSSSTSIHVQLHTGAFKILWLGRNIDWNLFLLLIIFVPCVSYKASKEQLPALVLCQLSGPVRGSLNWSRKFVNWMQGDRKSCKLSKPVQNGSKILKLFSILSKRFYQSFFFVFILVEFCKLLIISRF